MNKGTRLVIEGQVFATIRQACLAYGVVEGTAARRMRTGWSVRQAFGLDPKPKRKAHNAITLASANGIYRSIRAASAATGVEEKTIQIRLSRGWTVDQALEIDSLPKRETTRTKVSCEGVHYKSVSALARAFDLNEIGVRKRLYRGWSPEQAVDLEPPPPRFRDREGNKRNHPWLATRKINDRLVNDGPAGSFKLYVIKNSTNSKEYVGITTGDLKARLRGHRRAARTRETSKFYRAMRKHGVKNFEIVLLRDDATNIIELEEQEYQEIEKRNSRKKGYNEAPGGSYSTSKPIKIEGIEYPSYAAAADHYGVQPGTFNLRVSRLGWSPEEAAGLRPRRAYGRHQIKINGKVYKSLKSAAEDQGIAYKTVFKRLSDGWSVEQALGVKPPKRLARKIYEFKGKKYQSQRELAAAFGLKAATLCQRLARGATLEEALQPLSRRSQK
ncbi:GIY-YIG nuclease family protein [Pseudomonadales bacterium]|nr:GIY-YIG nuclease family protein [Pseudomonadales bacterium]